MNVTSISDFRKDTKKYFDQIIDDQDELLITRSDGKTIVAITLERYSSMSETEYLNRSPANRKHLEKGIAQLKAGRGIKKTLTELKSYE